MVLFQEKRYALEATEKKNLQDCLDILQQNIIVSTLSAIIERLTVISRHLGYVCISVKRDFFSVRCNILEFCLKIKIEATAGSCFSMVHIVRYVLR